MNRLLIILVLVFSLGAPLFAGSAAPSAEAIQPLLIGATTPDVQVRLVDGTSVNLKDLTKKQRTVLVFYRGGW